MIRLLLYFFASYAILGIQYNGNVLFNEMHSVTAPYTDVFYSFGERMTKAGIRVAKDFTSKIFTNATPSASKISENLTNDQISSKLSAIEKDGEHLLAPIRKMKIVGTSNNAKEESNVEDENEYTPEEEAFLKKIIHKSK